MMSIAVAMKMLYSYFLVTQYSNNPNTSISRSLKGRMIMKNPLDSLWGTVISGLVLTIVLYFIAHKLVAQVLV
jgi:hypothetical protein